MKKFLALVIMTIIAFSPLSFCNGGICRVCVRYKCVDG